MIFSPRGAAGETVFVFFVDGDDTYYIYSLKGGVAAVEPPVPTIPGKAFKGWTFTEGSTEHVVFPFTPLFDTIVYADAVLRDVFDYETVTANYNGAALGVSAVDRYTTDNPESANCPTAELNSATLVVIGGEKVYGYALEDAVTAEAHGATLGVSAVARYETQNTEAAVTARMYSAALVVLPA